ncbi:hypothetical protein KZX29_12155 [Moraxella osloensis]|uniref:hypothetical protein n=1 Tax=Faucicola osloensis TaxID=34062 RepID=UPI0020050D27|nr:hypothetical protein [Moraxella osloensis]MCK6159519.1 hypothetical protein [Moraxella osloensis]
MKKNGIITHCLHCNAEIYVQPSKLAQGRGRYCSRSCGAKSNSLKHGHTNHTKLSPTYTSWASMKGRCQNKNNPKYHMYGAVGITVCEKWQTFEGFLKDMGERPDGTSIDRIDGSLGYFKENCRWATITEQQRNLKSNVIVSYQGEEYVLKDLANKLGLSPTTLKYRIEQGWDESRYSEKPNQRKHLA